jgi:hypothetical protein
MNEYGALVGWLWTEDNGITGTKTCSSVAFSTTDPTSVDLGFSWGLRGEAPATNRRAMARPALIMIFKTTFRISMSLLLSCSK